MGGTVLGARHVKQHKRARQDGRRIDNSIYLFLWTYCYLVRPAIRRSRTIPCSLSKRIGRRTKQSHVQLGVGGNQFALQYISRTRSCITYVCLRHSNNLECSYRNVVRILPYRNFYNLRECFESPPSSAEVNNGGAIPPLPVSLHGVVLNCLMNEAQGKTNLWSHTVNSLEVIL
jgi:hypothetical protein